MTPLALLLLKLAAVAAPLGLLARTERIYPRPPLVWWALAPALATFAVLASPAATWGVMALDVVLIAATAGDALTLPGRKAFSAERAAGRVASLRKPHAVALTLLNHSRRPYQISVRDGMPEELHAEPAEFTLRVAPRSRSVLRYLLRPRRRGAFTAEMVHLRAAAGWDSGSACWSVPPSRPSTSIPT